MHAHDIPAVIQGGMGVGVSNWRLARAVSAAGGLGVISGTALDVILARRLQRGDPGGAMRRALDAFPFPEAARRIRERYFIPGGKAEDAPFAAVPLPAVEPSRAQAELGVAAAFAEVWLAKEGHHLPVGINLLEKIQLPTLLCLFGAMLAGVDLVLMGAGIPRQIPGILGRLAAGTLEVFTDPDASPTGFPFKVVRLPGTMADPAVTAARRRVCDLGFLRATYVREDGAPGFRCPGEPEADYLRKGGGALETAGRLCVCNGLFGTVGLAQCRSGTPEPALLTAGDDARLLGEWTRGRGSYSAAEVVGRLMAA